MTTWGFVVYADVLTDIAAADGVIAKEEGALMAVISKEFDIPISYITESRSMSVTQCLSILRGMDKNLKKDLGVFMVAMMAIDGDINQNEADIIVAVCSSADIPLPQMK